MHVASFSVYFFWLLFIRLAFSSTRKFAMQREDMKVTNKEAEHATNIWNMRRKNVTKSRDRCRKIRYTLKKLAMFSCASVFGAVSNRNLMLCMHHVLLVPFSHTPSEDKKIWCVRHSRYMSRLCHKTMTFIYFRRFRCLHSLYNSEDSDIYITMHTVLRRHCSASHSHSHSHSRCHRANRWKS